MSSDGSKFAPDYSEGSFWDKIKNYASSAGRDAILMALKLYYCLQSPKTPAWAKSVVIGALGYFISPIDAIPDLLPVIGYSDDIGVLAAAIAAVAAHIDDEIVAKAEEQLRRWFG
ncbi:DUF1232 domain-containing protein [Azospirillum sp. B21]|uniref:YkvA family protein n=1 Tax=Azospirillum sp. B21 TaxID=2607496 RepID=UPI0011ECCB5C|nr:YkvA family protein [Azospirillum sp. B21]KAA0581892.1 DUF1232 domain-containing protein [Azospirillum sp. B21]